MIFIRLYYLARPFIPRIVRLGLRRRHARKVAMCCNGSWPIKQSAQNPPLGWQGWPENKKFALVLTHDVEGPSGMKRVRQLAELEMELGFRSSFNLVPEGSYSVPKELRSFLERNGFEIGVHDLHHDGKLYSSRKSFLSKAARINHYLREWNASGFRSAFMMHNLQWIHALNARYDCSTFDVDPFEPQPDGVNTIFPFWVPDPGGEASRITDRDYPVHPERSLERGYTELPYTLPQDSTLFLFLEHKTNAIWKAKLDWVAQHGGMALLNVHPDYINFDSDPDKFRYPVDYYSDFLQYVKKAYHGKYWHALAKEVASHSAKCRPVCLARKPKNICLLAATNYDTDARVSRYAQTLLRKGYRVEVVACSPDGKALETLERDGVTVHNIAHSHEERKRGPISHLLILIVFFARAMGFVNKQHRKRPYDLFHVHNIPEWLVFAAWLPKLTGTPVLLDIHDLVPELFLAKFKKGERSILGPILRAVERVSCAFADHVIISNHLWKYKLLERSVPKSKCSVFINHIDLNIFYPRKRTRTDDRKIVLFHGSLQWHQGMDIAIRAFALMVKRVPTAELHIYGCGGEKKMLMELSDELGLGEKVLFFPLVPVTEIPQIIANADIGIVPKRVDSFGNEAYSTKIMEFMSQGVPVVISRTAIDSYYFSEQQVRFCESGNVEAFAEALTEILSNGPLRENMVRMAQEYVSSNHWGIKEREYLELVDRLMEGAEGERLATRPSNEEPVSTKPQLTVREGT